MVRLTGQSLPLAAVMLMLTAVPARAGIDNIRLVGHNEVNRAHLMDAEVVGERAFIANGLGQGLEVYDISDPAVPVRTWTGGPDAWRTRVYGDTLLFAFCRQDGVVRYGIVGAPVGRGQYNPPGNREALEGGALVGDTLYAAAHQNGIYLIDCSDPATITRVGGISLAPTAAAWNVEARDSFLFVANGRHGLAVIALAGTPRRIADLALPGLANDIIMAGDVAVLSLGASGLATVDLTDPYQPALLDIAATEGCAWGIGVSGNLVVCGSWRYLELFDITNPAAVRRAGWDNTKTWALGADISGDLIVIGDWRGMSTFRVGPDPGADIDVEPEALDFGAVSSPVETTIVVRNTGAGTLTVTSVDAPGGITVAPPSFSVSAGDSLFVTVGAAGSDRVNAGIVFNSNDPHFPAYRVEVYKNNPGFPQAGSAAPDFNLQGTDSRWHRLSDYRGKVVYLQFGASW
ncbi:MAG: hypothetical protein R6X14_06235 [bacterium]